MGARNSKRSMDVTTTPKKEGVAEGGETPAVGDGKLERIEEADAKPTTNGVAPHTDAPEDKDNEKEKDLPEKETNKTENETKPTEESSPAEAPAEAPPAEEEQVTTPTEETNTSTISASSPESKETMKKEKSKKKWSWRSISFSKKDKNKPVREETPKNGDVSKDESLAEGGEEAENAAASPVEEKSVTSLNESAAGENEVKNEEKPAAAPEVTSSPAEEKQEAPSSPTAPIPVPAEDKKEEKTEKEVEKVEVSPTQAVAAPIEVVSQPQPIIAPSIIERKTSEDFPSLLPSSPPPTPINPSPLQQAQSAAANASALAEALKLPAEADLANACRLDYHKNDNEIVNSEPESMESNIEIDSKAIENKEAVEEAAQVESKAIETQDVQSIVEDVHRENIDTNIPIEEHSSLTDLSDNSKTCPIEVEEIAIETTAAVVDQQTCNNQFEKIDENSKTEVIITSEQSTEDNIKEKDDDNNTDVKMEIDITIKTDTEDEEIPPPIPESPIPIPKASSQFINFITSQIEDSPPLSEPIETDNVMQPKLEIEDFSLQSTDNSIPSPPTEAVVDTSTESQNPLSLQEINNLPPPPPEVAACEQVPDIVSSNPQETVEDIPTLPRSPSPEVSLGTVESSNELVEPEVNDDKKIEAFVEKNNHEFVKETIAAPVEEINTKSDLENRQSDAIEDKTASVDSLLNHQIQKNDQSIPETEAPVENSTLNSTTESTEEIPKSPLASVQTEVTAPVAPAITEDVTSVTKAVEEIDINEKAVAAAVNENIESANKNEIIADMNYQNLNE